MYLQKEAEEITLEDIYTPNWQIFTVLSILNVLTSFWAHHLIYTKEIYYSLLSDQMEIIRIDEFIEILDRFSLMSLLLIPVIMLIKYGFITLIIQAQLLLKDIEISFKIMFRVILLSSIILTLGQIVHYVWIYFTPVNNISYELLAYNPLSIASYINHTDIPVSSRFICSQFNVFELFWCAGVYLGLMRTNKLKSQDAATVIFILWIIILLLQYGIFSFMGEIL